MKRSAAMMPIACLLATTRAFEQYDRQRPPNSSVTCAASDAQLVSLAQDDDDETAMNVAAGVAQRLGRILDSYAGSAHDELADIIGEFEDVATPEATYEGRWTRCRHFNDVMDSLYDWADTERVWIA
jgi:hypothetical protein